MMNREEVIRMAKEAGFYEDAGDITVGRDGDIITPQIVRFATLVAAAKQEQCAKVCEERGNRNRIAAGLPNGDRDEFYCADDIRALP